MQVARNTIVGTRYYPEGMAQLPNVNTYLVFSILPGLPIRHRHLTVAKNHSPVVACMTGNVCAAISQYLMTVSAMPMYVFWFVLIYGSTCLGRLTKNGIKIRLGHAQDMA